MEDNVFKGIEKEEIKLPLDILGEYEQQFTQAFGQKLNFQIINREEDEKDKWSKLEPFVVIQEPSEQKFVSRVYIVAPSLNNYRMLILKISYLRSKVYPCVFYDAFEEKSITCNKPDDLDIELKKLFLSEKFKKPIRMLLTQIG